MKQAEIAPMLAELWAAMPEETRQSARAEIFMAQAFMDAVRDVPEAQMAPLRAEFDRCLAHYVTPSPPAPAPPPTAPKGDAAAKMDEETIFEAVSLAAIACFDTTVDGSVARADALADQARDRGRARLHELTRNPLMRRRLMRRLEAEIARERSNVIF